MCSILWLFWNSSWTHTHTHCRASADSTREAALPWQQESSSPKQWRWLRRRPTPRCRGGRTGRTGRTPEPGQKKKHKHYFHPFRTRTTVSYYHNMSVKLLPLLCFLKPVGCGGHLECVDPDVSSGSRTLNIKVEAEYWCLWRLTSLVLQMSPRVVPQAFPGEAFRDTRPAGWQTGSSFIPQNLKASQSRREESTILVLLRPGPASIAGQNLGTCRRNKRNWFYWPF